MRQILAFVISILLIGVLAFPMLAHHSMAGTYDLAKVTTIRGLLTEIVWRNPHASVLMNAKDANGKIVSWRIEIAAPNALSRAGLSPQMLDMTSTYTIEISPAKDGSANACGRSLTLPDGRHIDVTAVWGPPGITN